MIQSLGSSETSRSHANDKNINVTARSGQFRDDSNLPAPSSKSHLVMQRGRTGQGAKCEDSHVGHGGGALEC